MTVQQLNSDNSDDSEDMVSLPPVEDIYRRKYQLLLERCEVLQHENDKLIRRIHMSKKTTRRYNKDVKLLMERLDGHGDTYRNLPKIACENEAKPRFVLKPQVTIKPEKTEKPSTPVVKKPPAKRKSKADRPEKDPNAPKKPCNAFFQFCQEQRPLVVAEANSENGIEPSKQEITRQLASKWRSLSNEEKRVYVAMFERSKEKYVEQMVQYNTIKKEQDL